MRFFPLLLLLNANLSAAMLYLINDTSFEMRAVVTGANNVYLGETVIDIGQTYKWTDTPNHFGAFGKGTQYRENMTKNQVPYVVTWYCNNGILYSRCDKLPHGATVKASACPGDRICHPHPTPPGPYPNQPEGQELYTPQPPFEFKINPQSPSSPSPPQK